MIIKIRDYRGFRMREPPNKIKVFAKNKRCSSISACNCISGYNLQYPYFNTSSYLHSQMLTYHHAQGQKPLQQLTQCFSNHQMALGPSARHAGFRFSFHHLHHTDTSGRKFWFWRHVNCPGTHADFSLLFIAVFEYAYVLTSAYMMN